MLYKVVKRKEFLDTHIYKSAVVQNQYALYYDIEQTTVPEIGYIMVFDDLEYAEIWARETIYDWTIMEGTGNALDSHWICSLDRSLAFELFWDMVEHDSMEVWEKRFNGLMYPPHHTKFVPSFTPTRIVRHNYE
jgi:hypothetical protein